MTSEKFAAGDWIDRLALALRSLAEAQESYLPEYYGRSRRLQIVFGEQDGPPPAFPLADVRTLYLMAGHSHVWGQEEYYVALCAALDPVRVILRSHPTLGRVASPVIGQDQFWLEILKSGAATSPTFITQSRGWTPKKWCDFTFLEPIARSFLWSLCPTPPTTRGPKAPRSSLDSRWDSARSTGTWDTKSLPCRSGVSKKESRRSSGGCRTPTANIQRLSQALSSACSSNSRYKCVPSQKGLFFELPQRHSVKYSVDAPSARSKPTRSGPPRHDVGTVGSDEDGWITIQVAMPLSPWAPTSAPLARHAVTSSTVAVSKNSSVFHCPQLETACAPISGHTSQIVTNRAHRQITAIQTATLVRFHFMTSPPPNSMPPGIGRPV